MYFISIVCHTIPSTMPHSFSIDIAAIIVVVIVIVFIMFMMRELYLNLLLCVHHQ